MKGKRKLNRFIPKEYWEIGVEYKKDKIKLTAELAKINGKKAEVPDEKMAGKIEKELQEGENKISDIKTKTQSRNAYAPFITSTLQQAANNLFGYPSIKTMIIAQQLYEGIDMGKTTDRSHNLYADRFNARYLPLRS